ncbi:hypothetical protein C5O25_05260 [Paramuribaculum intestinale]|uniref:Uncharacterized protein n=1 Tax=Paramuribaculum intestinale TaxID=2094151 RepID=A0A2V1J021_9BACT|nr:hypothetical protein [uncultured Duncaniella sp.]PWB06474.1 hypothetical protein C5O24_10000 [Paramuribaculum intestinale]PWB08004.1 hypothetical protein C5O25_05260 [Paramuribaculum intestinale]ROS92134.1 hypothetical protein EEL36_09375 [Muribaculaceae bacterium Isolate-043 (Harlan)]
MTDFLPVEVDFFQFFINTPLIYFHYHTLAWLFITTKIPLYFDLYKQLAGLFLEIVLHTVCRTSNVSIAYDVQPEADYHLPAPAVIPYPARL